MLFDLLVDEALDLVRAFIYGLSGRDEPKRKGRQGIARRLVKVPRRRRGGEEVAVIEETPVEIVEAEPRRRGSALPWLIAGAVGVGVLVVVWQRMNANAEAPLVTEA
jgi:hypothetical protein